MATSRTNSSAVGVAALRWELEWKFANYPLASDAVWDPTGVCEGYEWADYSGDLVIQPGDIFTLIFQVTTTLSVSGAHYNEVLIKLSGWLNFANYGGTMAGVSVPLYDLKSVTSTSVLRVNTVLTSTGLEPRSWHWEKHR